MRSHHRTAWKQTLLWGAILNLTACQAERGTQPVELTVLDYADPTVFAFKNEREPWDSVQAQTKEFAILKIERLIGEPFRQKLEGYTVSHHLPDIVFLWPSGPSSLLPTRNLVKDLTPLLGADYLKDFSLAAINPRAQAGGELVELPSGVTATHVLYVNTTVLENLGLKPAATYEELKSQAPKLKAAGLEVILMANEDEWVMSSCLFSAIVGRLAGNLFLDDLRDGKTRFTDPPFVSALAFVQTLYADGVLSKASLHLSYGEAPGLFSAGRAAYYIDGDWRASAFSFSLNDQKKIRLTVFPVIPGQISDATDTSIAIGTGYGINASIEPGSAKEKAAVEVLKALQSQEAQRIRLDSGTSFPSRTDVGSGALGPLAVARKDFSTQATGSYALDAVFGPAVMTPLNEGLREIGLGTKKPEDVALAVQKAFDDWKAFP